MQVAHFASILEECPEDVDVRAKVMTKHLLHPELFFHSCLEAVRFCLLNCDFLICKWFNFESVAVVYYI